MSKCVSREITVAVLPLFPTFFLRCFGAKHMSCSIAFARTDTVCSSAAQVMSHLYCVSFTHSLFKLLSSASSSYTFTNGERLSQRYLQGYM
jgi:hypothetical protein